MMEPHQTKNAWQLTNKNHGDAYLVSNCKNISLTQHFILNPYTMDGQLIMYLASNVHNSLHHLANVRNGKDRLFKNTIKM